MLNSTVDKAVDIDNRSKKWNVIANKKQNLTINKVMYDDSRPKKQKAAANKKSNNIADKTIDINKKFKK